MTQTLAVFYEAYRNLNSRKLFWISIVISALVVAALATLGVNDSGISILFWQFDNGVVNAKTTPPAVFYKALFTELGVRYWLAWIATLLALISTAGIFPDLITSGSIDLYVARPIGRLRLFLTEYLAGLLFVTLQVGVFCLGCFLLIGLRGGQWAPGVFLAVPLVVGLFSYLFSVCVLVGLLTRSTVAALLLTLLFWCFVFAVGLAEEMLLSNIAFQRHGINLMDPAAAAKDDPSRPDGPEPGQGDVPPWLITAHRVAYGVKTVLPKTTDMTLLLNRAMISAIERRGRSEAPNRRFEAAGRELTEEMNRRGTGWIVGTSLGFEAVVLALAALVFCRRDF